MDKQKMNQILEQIARKHNTTPAEVYEEMRLALDEAQRSKNPLTKARWKRIPRKGENVTVEEFIEYIGKRISS